MLVDGILLMFAISAAGDGGDELEEEVDIPTGLSNRR